jgi:DNA-directed RNA polymerase alpha subunit
MLDIQKYIGSPKIITPEIDPLTMKFELQYVPRGFGHTLGNALRRAIL